LIALPGTGRRLRPLAAALAAALALPALAACGDDPDPEQVIEEGLSQPIESADVTMSLAFEVEGGEQAEPFRVELSGPCTAREQDRFASFDYDVALQGGGASVPGVGVISTGDNAYIEVQGVAYEIGQDVIGQLNRAIAESGEPAAGCGALGLQLGAFGGGAGDAIVAASVEDGEEVAGVPTTHVSGSIDVPGVLADLNELTQRAGELGGSPSPTLTDEQLTALEDRIQGATVDVFVGEDDGKVRRFAATLEVAAAEGAEEQLGGVTGGTVSLVLEYAEVGEEQEQEIETPDDPQPLEDLAQQLGDLGGLLGEPGAPGAGEPVLPAP
jgi:hypothetical protein